MIGRAARLCVRVAPSLVLAASVAAQPVQRCETPAGKVTYSNSACPPGTHPVRQLDPDPAPSAADQKAANERTQRHMREVERLERDRAKEEQKAEHARAAAEERERRHASECRSLDLRVRTAREEFDSATLQKRPQADRKLRVAQEQYDARCRQR